MVTRRNRGDPPWPLLSGRRTRQCLQGNGRTCLALCELARYSKCFALRVERALTSELAPQFTLLLPAEKMPAGSSVTPAFVREHLAIFEDEDDNGPLSPASENARGFATLGGLRGVLTWCARARSASEADAEPHLAQVKAHLWLQRRSHVDSKSRLSLRLPRPRSQKVNENVKG